jgi:hypothetical protein
MQSRGKRVLLYIQGMRGFIRQSHFKGMVEAASMINEALTLPTFEFSNLRGYQG